MDKMSKTAKERLAKIPVSRCKVCNTPRYHTNPIAKCYICKEKFCYDHIWGGQTLPELKLNDSLVDLCDACREANLPEGSENLKSSN